MAYIHQINAMDFENSFQEGGFRHDMQSKLPVGAVVSVFVNYCSFHCLGCWNSDTWERKDDLFVEDEKVAEQIIEGLDQFDLNPPIGLSFLGGDPILPQNAESTANIIRLVLEKKPNIVIGLWTGYKFEYLLKHADENQKYILEHIDVIIDGRFIEKKKIANKRYGSYNQRVINVPKSLKKCKTIFTESYQLDMKDFPI
ncbi:ribonucleotide reductase of class III (anaerobic), activating protein [Lactococcus phage P1048]|uniref:Ribonucleotide reductase of class III (Anaerobic), activating protein n=1 Tax=Lactococcus phage P1048 TaxID=2662295 RepID=A0A649V273_9CAUD|nr:anaerobic ribonucleotide reductase small subunit [Lactococcus phage P1048]QGJ84981.1 ribonucleotide reductase of class III (anaerobic), activating protein [Lactococcus phage P1048]